MSDRTTVDRFVAKLAPEGDCWRWTGSLHRQGYGFFHHEGRMVMAHRWSYEYHRTEIPGGLVLDHLCRNEWCCNPWHLEPVTQTVNIHRGARGALIKAFAQGGCSKGHDTTAPGAICTGPSGRRRCRQCTRERNLQYRARTATR